MEVYAAEGVAVPVSDSFVLFFEVGDEVLAIASMDVLDAEVIYDEAELDGTGSVLEEACSDACGDVAAFRQMGE